MAILLTDAEYKNSLAILRALSRKNLEVYCSGNSKRSLSFYSKYCQKRFQYSHPLRQSDRFKAEMLSLVKKFDIEVLMPVGIGTFTLVSQIKDELEKYTKVPVADYELFEQAHDKEIVNQIAVKNNIPAPLTYSPKTEKELKKILKEYTYPVVIKARKGSSTNQVEYAFNQDQALKIWKKYSIIGEKETTGIIDHSFPIIQEFLPGEIVDIVFVFNNGKPRGVVSQRRELTYPVSGGSGALNRTTNDPETIKQALKLMKALKWHGVGMAEFKRNKDGVAKLIEVNPKFWGTTECSVSAGMNFPYMLYKIAIDGDVEPNLQYLAPKPFGWPVPMGLQTMLASKNPLQVVKEYLKLAAYTNSTDIVLNEDPKPFTFQLQTAALILLRKFGQKAIIRKINKKG